ncbi:hypothetical protein ACP4OV_011902 [Aristida adscensionis]
MMRRFVNLVSQKCRRSVDSSTMYSLHRLDVAGHLFYPSTAAAQEARAGAAAKEDGGAAAGWPPAMQMLRQLPAPAMAFEESSRVSECLSDARFFALLSPRDSEGRILFSNRLGHCILYDADANAVTTMPDITGRLGCHSITIPLARPGSGAAEPQDLYVMHPAATTCCFGVLRFGAIGVRQDWRWDPLPAPPLGHCTHICSHAVPATHGTYCFDTVKREWKRAGDWLLPFSGGAEHAPGLGDLWIALADNGRSLCAASGLSAAMETAPALQHVWGDAGRVPGNWRPIWPRLIDLGGGRFCIAKTCIVMPDTEYEDYSGPGIQVAVLSGVELLAGGDGPTGTIDVWVTYAAAKQSVG